MKVQKLIGSICVIVAVLALLSSAQATNPATFQDTFDSGLNSQNWTINKSDEPSAPWSVMCPNAQGQLQLSKSADTAQTSEQGPVYAKVVSKFTLVGDFSVVVDFNLANFNGGVDRGYLFAHLGVVWANDNYFDVARWEDAGNQEVGSGCVLGAVVLINNFQNSPAATGRYKIERKGVTLSGYIDCGYGFVLVSTITDARLSQPVQVTLDTGRVNDSVSNLPTPTVALDVRYDNLTITADSIIMPTSVPAAPSWAIPLMALLLIPAIAKSLSIKGNSQKSRILV